MLDVIILPYEGNGDEVQEKEVVETPKQDRQWTEYNLYQTQERILAYKIINDVVNYLQLQNKPINGRPSVEINDMIKSLLVKSYNNISARRLNSELIMFKGLGYIDKVYHFNTILKYLGDPEINYILETIMKELAVPMKELEKYFAIDATGFSTLDKKQWKEIRLDFKVHKDYRKLHMICGVKTNVIVSAYVTEGTCNDSPYFKPLLEDTTKRFKIEEISADAGYLSRDNCDSAKSIGASPYIMPKKNVTARAKGSFAWREMVLMWQNNLSKFNEHYHKRSNAESTFSMIKRKFGNTLRGHCDTTKENEIMCKVCCHNISVLVEAMMLYNAKPHF